jgi:hypothetical protein
MNLFIDLLIAFILIAPAFALDQCQPVTDISEIPCQVVSTWAYAKPCNINNATVLNESGENIANYTYDVFGSSEFCAFTFNISQIGFYKIKVTNGDSASMTVGNKMQNVLIYGGYLLITLILIVFMHVFKKDNVSSMIYGFISATISFIMLAVQLSGFKIFEGLTFIIAVDHYLQVLTLAIGFYCFLIGWSFYASVKREGVEVGNE